ncbi:HAD family hydrolase [Kribbella sp. WER1]
MTQPLDLLLTADELADHLRTAVAEGDHLNAYLYTAGLHQLLEDHLHPDPLLLRRAAAYLHTSPAGHLAEAVARVLQPRTDPQLVAASHQLSAATISYATAYLTQSELTPVDLPVLRLNDVARVPSCFRSFDQHPDDVVLLANRFMAQYGTADSVCVVGIRTSGSYLAPLCVATLRTHSVNAELLTYRPGRGLRPDERRTLQSADRIVLIDDPPVSGTALATAAKTIAATNNQITMLLALAGDEPPPALRPWPGIYLPWTDWTVHTRLTEAAVSAQLSTLLGHPVQAHPLPNPTQPTHRGRIRARYEIRTTTSSSEIVVEGVGLGYFGDHAALVADRLPAHCPRVYGVADGLLYREWIPDGQQVAPRPEDIVRYVVERADALRVPRDPTALLRGRSPVWEVGGGLLSGVFGRLAPVGQVVFTDRIVRGLIRTSAPTIVDGQTDVRHWVFGRKTGFDERSFGNLELGCYDETFDLAGAAADPPEPGFEAQLREQYRWHTGRSVDLERWLIYRLAHLWRLRRAGDLPRSRTDELSAIAVTEYLAAVLDATKLDGGGDLCAIDLDGTLESDPLGYPCATPAGVLALRALAAHGYAPILATGRSLPEAIARGRTFGLRGVVAEYGAVSYDSASGQVTDHRDARARTTIEQLRERLHDVPLDERFRYVVRLPRLDAELEQKIGPKLLAQVRIIRGDEQVDLVPRGITKGTPLDGWAEPRGNANSTVLGGVVAMAVGDSVEDLPLFDLAGLGRAPRNAAGAVRAAGVVVTRGGYQAGLAEACGDLLGHQPGRCPRCRAPELPDRSKVLLAVLGLRENGLRGLPARTIRLALRSSRW